MGISTAVTTAAAGPSQSLCAALIQGNPPGEPDHVIHLESNENPYGPSRRTGQAIRRAYSFANRYPQEARDLAGNIARFHGVKSEQVILGSGSTEILRVAAQAFLGPDKQLLQSSPTFDALEFYARSVNAEVISLPLTHDYAHDLASMRGLGRGLDALSRPQTQLGHQQRRCRDYRSFCKFPAIHSDLFSAKAAYTPPEGDLVSFPPPAAITTYCRPSTS